MAPIASALRLTFTESHTFRAASTVPGYLAPGMAHFFRDGKFDSSSFSCSWLRTPARRVRGAEAARHRDRERCGDAASAIADRRVRLARRAFGATVLGERQHAGIVVVRRRRAALALRRRWR